MKPFLAIGAAALTLITSCYSSSGQVNVNVVVQTDDRPAGVPSFSRFYAPVASGTGQAAFAGSYRTATDNWDGIFVGTNQIVRGYGSNSSGDPAPGTDLTFHQFGDVFVNGSGKVAFSAGLSLVGRGGFWAGEAGQIQLIATNDMMLPGTTGTFTGGNLTAFNDAGQVAMVASISGALSDSQQGIWVGNPGALTLVARDGEQAAGFEAGVKYQGVGFGKPLLNNVGQVAFIGGFSGYQSDVSPLALWVGLPGQLQLVARTGQPAPMFGDAAILNVLGGAFGFNSAGQAAFLANARFGTSSTQVLLIGGDGPLQEVVRDKTQAPGLEEGVRFDGFGAPAINAEGEVLFSAYLKTAGAGSIESIWVGKPGQLRLVARVGQAAPGIPDGHFIAFDSNARLLSDSGQVAFLASVQGPSGSGGQSLFATDHSGVLQLVAKYGDSVAGSPAAFTFGLHPGAGSAQPTTATGDGRRCSFDRQGNLIFKAEWSEQSGGFTGREAIFRASFPAAAPSIPTVGQPAHVAGIIGGNATFEVTALGSRPATYQWKRNGENIPNATGAILDVSGLEESDRGSYTVVVTNAHGDVESAPAQLSFPPAITAQPQSQSVGANLPVSFSVTASAPGTLTYLWQHKATGAGTYTNLNGATQATLSFGNTVPSQAGRYRVVISNEDGSTTSAEAVLTVASAGEPIIERLLLTGDPASLIAGGSWSGGGNAVLDNSGGMAFTAGLRDSAGTNVNFPAAYRGLPGEAEVLYTIDIFDLNLSDSGDASMKSNLLSSNNDNNNGSLHGVPGAVEILAQEGTPAPGTTSDFDLGGEISLNAEGTAAFVHGTGFAFDTPALYVGTPGQLQLLARAGHAVPNMSGMTFEAISGIDGVPFNDSGTTAFVGVIDGSGVTDENDEGVWLASTSSVQRVLAEGSPAPGVGTGAVFGSFVDSGFEVRMNNAGEIAFLNRLTGGNVTGANDEVVYAGAPSTLQIAARKGQTVAGLKFLQLVDVRGTPLINATGHVAFTAIVEPTGTTQLLESLWRWTPSANGGTHKLIARDGQQAPGCPAGVVFGSSDYNQPFFDFCMNADGQIAFRALLKGPGVNDASGNNYGLWLTTPSGEAKLVARTGVPFDVGGGVMGTLHSFHVAQFGSGGEDGLARVLSDRGELIFGVSLNDFVTDGIFRASLPGSSSGGDGAPEVTASEPVNVKATTATLKGLVNPMGAATTVRFEYGTTTAYGASTPDQTVPAGDSEVAVSGNLKNLAADTLYHYRLVATNSGGTSTTPDATFTTADTSVGPFSITLAGVSSGDIILPNNGVKLSAQIEPKSAEKKIANVQFFVDGVPRGQPDTKPSFKLALKDNPNTPLNEGLDPGERIITAVATDKSGNVVETLPVEVIAEAEGGGPLALRATASATAVAPGGLITYTLSLVNTTRRETADSVRVDLTAPSRTTIVNAAVEGEGIGVVSADGETLTYLFKKVGPQQSRRITVFVRVPFDYPADEGSVDIHTFKVGGRSNGKKFTGEFPFVETVVSGTPVGDAPFLTLSKRLVDRADTTADDVDFIYDRELGKVYAAEPGDVVSVELSAFNGGNGTAERVILTERLPDGVTLVRSSIRVNNQLGSDKLRISTDRTLHFHLGDIAAGSRVVVSYQFRINERAKGGPALNAIIDSIGARISTAGLDSSVRSSPFEVPIKVVNPVAMGITATAYPAQSIAGEETTYTIRFTNNGGKTAKNVVITAEIPYGTTFDRVEGADASSVVHEAGRLTIPVGNLAGEGFGEVKVVVDVTQAALSPAGESISDLVAQVDQGSVRRAVATTLTSPESSVRERNRVQDLDRANLCITRTAPLSVKEGELFHHTIVVANTTRGFAADVLVVFNVPAGAEFVSSTAQREGGLSAPGVATVTNGRFTQFLNGLSGGDVIGIDVTFRATGSAGSDIIDNTLHVTPFQPPEEITFAPVIAGVISTRILPANVISFLAETPVGAYFAYTGGDTSSALADPEIAQAVARRVTESSTVTTVAGADYVQLLSGAVLIPLQSDGRIVAAGAGNIVAAGAGNIVAAGGGNIVAAGAGNLVQFNNLIGPDGGTLASQDGRALIQGIVAAGAGNIVAAGGGNIVAAGAGNLVGPDGATLVGPDGASFSIEPLINSIVAAGGGNIVAAGAGNIVAAGAGNLIGIGGGSLIGPDGGSLVSNDVTKAVSIGLNGNFFAGHGGNLLEIGRAPIVAAGAGN